MKQSSRNGTHPGAYIRDYVIPTGLSVTAAAKRLGVGRPALSNLLNGNSSLSAQMAVRLEKTFGADRQKLLELQAEFDGREQRGEEKHIAVRTYVPPFLAIKARQIQQWSEQNLVARQLLPVLLRRLVHSTAHDLREVDFPGYDHAERKGPDGKTVSGEATPWIPAGVTVWEFGVSRNVGQKADGDYAARTRLIPPAERLEGTFIFVTPRNWPGKGDWVASKRQTKDWKEVRAFDAGDLEQWLEESIPAQMWFAEQLGLPVDGFETLDGFWRRWSESSEPVLSPELFEPSLRVNRKKIQEWLISESRRPFVVAADSTDEAKAFLACVFRDREIGRRQGDLVAVVESVTTLRKLAKSAAAFIPVVFTQEAECELATVYRQRHCIVIRPRNAVDSTPNIVLDRLDRESFLRALEDMGIERQDAELRAKESGRSPTILRRQLSVIPGIRRPVWAEDSEAARSLIPMALIGAWDKKSSADRQVMSELAGRAYEEIEKSVALLLRFDDVPVWCAGQYRGVASKIDALFAIGSYVIESEIEHFFSLAERVLSETDPALELPQDERWAASVHGKVRDHSSALRAGISETLVILATHGDTLFGEQLGIDFEGRVASLVQKLMMPLTVERLLSHQHDLPNYAEAAPENFLALIEADLRRDRSAVIGFLEPAESGPFGGCPRTGLLWALECLAWKYIGRVSSILAEMSKIEINDNWTNKPVNSLSAIFRSWMPQTAASLSERIVALEMLVRRHPAIGWNICINELKRGPRMGTYSHRPGWRSDASGAGEPLSTGEEVRAFIHKALELVLAWPEHDGKTLNELVELIPDIPDEEEATVWELIDAWSKSETDAREKAELAERIRRFALTRLGERRGVSDRTKQRARSACTNLRPNEVVVKHAWLFSRDRIELSTEHTGNEDHYSLERHEKVRKIRANAMAEIWEERGFDGVLELLSGGALGRLVGDSMALCVTDKRTRVDFCGKCLAVADDDVTNVDASLAGFLRCIHDDDRHEILSAVADADDVENTIRLFCCAPFGERTWRLLDAYGEEARNRYWRNVSPGWNRYSDSELTEIIVRLVEAGRPRAAFDVVQLDWSRVETSRLKHLLWAIATRSSETEVYYDLDAYYISKALDSLGGRDGIAEDEMAQLEFTHINALRDSEHGIPFLERQIERSPIMFVQALALLFRRADDGQDPSEWQIKDAEQRKNLAHAAHSLLGQFHRLPGTNKEGKVNVDELLAWIEEVRSLCAEYGRAEIGDQYIGQLLSTSRDEERGIWPCNAVCEVMEEIASEELARGFVIGVRNARGAHWRDKGGTQERELAAKYRTYAEKLAIEFPYASSVVSRITTSYESDAKWQDVRAETDDRLR